MLYVKASGKSTTLRFAPTRSVSGTRGVVPCLLCFSLVLPSSWLGALRAQEVAKPANRPESRAVKRVDWGLLIFKFGDRKVTRVKIVLNELRDPGPFFAGVERKDRFEFETDERIVCRLTETFLYSSLRLPIPDDEDIGFGGNYLPLGHIVVTTTKESFIVGITTYGFMLQSKEHDVKNLFFSWGLAQTLDRVVFQRTKQHLQQEILDGLSGEVWMYSHKSTFKALSKGDQK